MESEKPWSLEQVLEELMCVSDKWEILAVHLGVPTWCINNTSTQYNKDGKLCLDAIIREWLSQDQQRQWADIVSALRKIDENALAQQLEDKYCQEGRNQLIQKDPTPKVLPSPAVPSRASGCTAGGYLYILGGCIFDDRGNTIDHNYAYRVPLLVLLESNRGDNTFQRIADIPFPRSACATISDRVVAIGGTELGEAGAKSINHVYMYSDVCNVWEHVGSLNENRCFCFAAVLTQPTQQLMVVGGYTQETDVACTNSTEIAELSPAEVQDSS